jgi:hypothetical protein
MQDLLIEIVDTQTFLQAGFDNRIDLTTAEVR